MNPKSLLFAVCLSTVFGITEAAAQWICVADLTLTGQGKVQVEITPRADGLFDATINGTVTRSAASVTEELVRPGLNFDADRYGREFASYNSAEKSLVHMSLLLRSPETRLLVLIPFVPSDVRKVKTYDLVGKTDKFGGTVLLDAYTEDGVPLGKVFRRVLPATCR